MLVIKLVGNMGFDQNEASEKSNARESFVMPIYSPEI